MFDVIPHHFDAFLGEIGKVRHCRKIYDHIHYRTELSCSSSSVDFSSSWSRSLRNLDGIRIFNSSVLS